jgi:hypothetical protein
MMIRVDKYVKNHLRQTIKSRNYNMNVAAVVSSLADDDRMYRCPPALRDFPDAYEKEHRL